MNQSIAAIKSRLPMPQGLADIDEGKWRVLVESVFPSAKTAEAVVMALDYCRVRKLDPFKRPVNIVPMWNKELKKEVETVWPGINEVQVTASRTGQYAGMDTPVFGPDVTKTFEGVVKGYNEEGKWEEGPKKVTLTFPESCAVTVYRMIGGVRCPFTEPVFWLECYAHRGKSEIPNMMWEKRPRGQFLKVAKAFSLRAAFPEEGEYTAEEMEGKEIASGGVVIEHPPAAAPIVPAFKTATLRNQFHKNVKDSMTSAETLESLNEIARLNKEKFDAMRASGDDRDAVSVEDLHNFYLMRKGELRQLPREGSEADINALRGFPADDLDEEREAIEGQYAAS